jgi:hypothetical protein
LRGLFATRRARRYAISILEPLVAECLSRMGPPSPAMWLDPYRLGLIATSLVILARQKAPSLGDEALAIVQGDAWVRLTGLSEKAFSQETCHLSLTADPDFVAGCSDALRLAPVPSAPPDDDFGLDGVSALSEWGALWSGYFERSGLPDSAFGSAGR